MDNDDVYAIVLAAGSARRFGTTKQLATLQGQPLVARATRLAESVCANRVVLVTGKNSARVAAACAPLAGFITVNTEYEAGLSSSIRAGIEAVRPVARGALLLLADQPLVSTDDLLTLLARWRRRPGAIVTSSYAGTTGPPVIFPRKLFPELAVLRGDRGARQVIDEHADLVERVECEAAGVDIDRPQDLEKLRS
jgi:molybdenum cofactor cytidylyltransferase